jgi:nickel superoxide dismutase
MKTFTKILTVLFFALLLGNKAYSHCEMPCGIYEDSLRIQMILESITTIEKAMNQITEMSAAGDKNYNQIVRWVMTKDEHCDQIQTIVSQYFMTQRVKPVDPSDQAGYSTYIQQITLLHQMLVYAMKAKQTTDLQYIDKLKQTLNTFAKSYFGSEHKH